MSNPRTEIQQELYKKAAAARQAFGAADEAWSQELIRLFGRNAGDIRYTKEGKTGPTLAPLNAEFARTRDAWYDAMDAWNKAMKEPAQ